MQRKCGLYWIGNHCVVSACSDLTELRLRESQSECERNIFKRKIQAVIEKYENCLHQLHLSRQIKPVLLTSSTPKVTQIGPRFSVSEEFYLYMLHHRTCLKLVTETNKPSVFVSLMSANSVVLLRI